MKHNSYARKVEQSDEQSGFSSEKREKHDGKKMLVTLTLIPKIHKPALSDDASAITLESGHDRFLEFASIPVIFK